MGPFLVYNSVNCITHVDFMYPPPQSSERASPLLRQTLILSLFRVTPIVPPSSWQSLISITSALYFRDCHINGIMQCVTLWGWLLSLSIMLLRLIQVVVYINNSFISVESHFIVWIFHIHSCIEVDLGFPGYGLYEWYWY